MTEITSRLSTALADRYRIERHLGEGEVADRGVRMGRWGLILVLAALTGCGDALSPVDVAGTYEMISYNGEELPVVIQTNPTGPGSLTLDAAILALNEDETCFASATQTLDDGVSTTTTTGTGSGTYTLVEPNTIRIDLSGQVFEVTFEGDRLMHIDRGGNRLVYER